MESTRFLDQLVAKRGYRAKTAPGANRPGDTRPICRPKPFGFPLLHTLRPQIEDLFVSLCSTRKTSAHSAFFCMEIKHKKPLAGPAEVAIKSYLLRGKALCMRSSNPSHDRVDSHNLDLDLAAAPDRLVRPSVRWTPDSISTSWSTV